MTQERIFNFNAGPAALPLPVLKEIQASFLNFKGSGMSITEVSHRSAWFDDVINDAVARTRRLLNLDDRFHVLFLQGGASLQFAMIPMNFLGQGKTADYVNTGTWSTKAIKEAEIQGKSVQRGGLFRRPQLSPTSRKGIAFTKDADAVFAHITSNNTIKGTQWAEPSPIPSGVPIVSDMSPRISSQPAAGYGQVRPDLRRRLEKHGTGRRPAWSSSVTTCWPAARKDICPPCCKLRAPTRPRTPCSTPRPASPSTPCNWCSSGWRRTDRRA